MGHIRADADQRAWRHADAADPVLADCRPRDRVHWR
jgi:hypothetical protein